MHIKTKLDVTKNIKQWLDNDLVAIPKSEVILMFNKPVYVGMWVLDLNTVLMYKFHYDWIKNRFD